MYTTHHKKIKNKINRSKKQRKTQQQAAYLYRNEGLEVIWMQVTSQLSLYIIYDNMNNKTF